VKLGERAIADVDWTKLRVLRGTGAEYADTLRAFLRSEDFAAAELTWNDIENVVFAQNTIYEAAEPTVLVLLAALADNPAAHMRGWIVELLFMLLNGASIEDPDLANRCREQAMRGIWLLAGEAATSEAAARSAVLDVIRLIDPVIERKLVIWLS
jgi:hypothetical protein